MTIEWHFYLVQPVHLCCLLALAEPSDRAEGCESMLTCAQFTLRGVKVLKLLPSCSTTILPMVSSMEDNAQRKCNWRSLSAFEEFLAEVIVWQHGYGAVNSAYLVLLVLYVTLQVEALLDVSQPCEPFVNKRRVTSLYTEGRALFIGVLHPI